MQRSPELPRTTEAPIPLFDQIPEITPLRNAYGDLPIDPEKAGSPEATYGHLLLAYSLLTEAPAIEKAADTRKDTILDTAQQPFFDIVIGLQAQLSANSSPTALQDMIDISRASLARTDWSNIKLDGAQTVVDETMRLYLLTLLKGDARTYKKVGGFLQRQCDALVGGSPTDTHTMAQADKYVNRPWAAQDPFTYDTSFGFKARDHKKIAQYYAARTSGGLATALSELTPYAKTVQELTQQMFAHCEAFEVTRKFSEIIAVEWQLLPPGDLRAAAEELVAEAQERRAKTSAPLEVDLDRLQILEEVRKAWGPNTRYTRGIATGRQTAQASDGKDVPNDYIVLVLQETDAQGKVIREHAVANSPITKNGLYIYRQDTQKNGEVDDWSVAFSLPKSDAMELGARRLNHPPRNTPRMSQTMAQKTIHLLTCPPEQFTTLEFHGVDGAGDVITRSPRQKIARPAGATALYAQISAGLHELATQYF